MRPQQQNRRMRGRGNNNGGGGSGSGSNNNNNNNNNRKGPNPLTRNYESNGPDVKIRGSAQQIAEKYTTLARDSQSSGDRVMAENYLQHAEHYNRIIAAAQAQMPIQQAQNSRDDFNDDQDEDRDDFDNSGNGGSGDANDETPAPDQSGRSNMAAVSNGSGPQPVIDGTPAEVALNAESGGHDTGGRHRERRPHTPRAAPAAAQDASEAPASTANGDDGEGAAAPRRGRRPRRGERSRDGEADSATDGGSNEAAAEAETPGSDPALASADS